MYDILELLHIDTKEDVYTFCLGEFLSQSELYREKSAEKWGFKKNTRDYDIYRGAISVEDSTKGNRSKIVPDLILYNDKHIAVIESKMFSSEGYMQTSDYIDSKKTLIEFITNTVKSNNKGTIIQEKDVEFYYFTLAGVPSKSDEFKTIQWADYYVETLTDVKFDDDGLNALGQAILRRAQDYKEISSSCESKLYSEIANSKNSWITLYSLFLGNALDEKWALDRDVYSVYNGRVNGQGHSTFRTDICNENEHICKGRDEHSEDNILFFTRIEWKSECVNVVINMEYWFSEKENGKRKWINYIPYSKLSDVMKEKSQINRNNVCDYLESVIGEDKELRIPTRKKNMLHMLIKSIKTEGKTLTEVINEIKQEIIRFERIKDDIAKNIITKDNYLFFDYPQVYSSTRK